jgi:hypothetical protein
MTWKSISRSIAGASDAELSLCRSTRVGPHFPKFQRFGCHIERW